MSVPAMPFDLKSSDLYYPQSTRAVFHKTKHSPKACGGDEGGHMMGGHRANHFHHHEKPKEQ